MFTTQIDIRLLKSCPLAVVMVLVCMLQAADAATVFDLSAGEEDVLFVGETAADETGAALAIGDINNDGFSDMVIGALAASPGGDYRRGKLHVVLGSANLPASVDLANSDMVVLGRGAEDLFAENLVLGDFNSDGYEDMIIGAPGADPGGKGSAGEVYVIFGQATLPSLIDLSTATADIEFRGAKITEALGSDVASGDINGDQIDDMIFSANDAAVGDSINAGKTYVVFGHASLLPSVIDLAADSVDVEVHGRRANDRSGNSIAVADMNNDNFDDLLISAKSAPGGVSSGEAYVVLGGANLNPIVDLRTDADLRVRGSTPAEYLGWDISGGDINRDGYDDMIIGAAVAGGGFGATYLIYGSASVSGFVDLSAGGTVGLEIHGEEQYGYLGWTVESMDYNGDGFADLVATSPFHSGAAGEVYTIFGEPTPPSFIDLAVDIPDVLVIGGSSGDYAGVAFASGDINSDGVEDLLIGAPGVDSLTGAVYLIYGEVPYLEVSITTASSTYNLPLTVAATIDSTSGMLLVESAMEVSFNSDLLTVTSVTPGALTPSWTVGYTICIGPGAMDTLKVSASTTSSPADSTGEFLQINFWVNKLRYAISAPVTIESLTFNGNETDFTQSTPGPVTLLGNDGDLAATLLSEPGDVVRVRVTDVDLNIDPANIETFPVTLENNVTGEQETVVLTEQSVDDLVFFGTLSTAFGTAGTSEDGTLHTQSGEEVSVVYTDPLSLTGPTTPIVDTHRVVVLGDADGSGSLQAYDSALILSHAVNHLTLVGLDSLVANLDIDAPESAITAFDAALAIQRRLGLISSFPVQGPTSKNHPQPETTNNPKPVVEERYLALASTDDYISVRVDARDEILAADLLLSGIEGRIEMAPEMELFEVVYVNAEDGLHVAFAGPRSVEGAGELFRIYPTSASAKVRDLSGHFNGGRIAAYLGHGGARSARPLRLALHPNRPNPFNPETLIRFDLPTAQTVSLDIFNALGQKVRTLVQGRTAAGSHNVRWDSRDEQGQAVATGPYFYRLSAGSSVQTQRMMLVK